MCVGEVISHFFYISLHCFICDDNYVLLSQLVSLKSINKKEHKGGAHRNEPMMLIHDPLHYGLAV